MKITFKKIFGLCDYESEVDLFLKAYEKKHPAPSASQQQERAKHAKIADLRDVPFNDAPP